MHKLLFSLIAVPAILIGSTQEAKAYTCWEGKRDLLPGVCLPVPNSSIPNPALRTALYVRCRGYKGGEDEYTRDCCEHLTSADAQALFVCERDQSVAMGLDMIFEANKFTNIVGSSCVFIDCDELMRWYDLY